MKRHTSLPLSFLPVLLLYAICAAAGFISCVTSRITSPPVVQEPPAKPKTQIPPAPQMVSLEDSFDSGYWVTAPMAAPAAAPLAAAPGGPEDTAITIIGIAGRRANRDEAIQEALADAARKAALYHGVRAESAAVLNQGSGNLDYFSDFDYRIAPANSHEAYIDALIFDKDNDILEKNGVVIVRTRYPGGFSVPVYESPLEDGIPAWVKNYTADIPGFLAGVGYSRNKGSLQRTHTASYEAALVSLLPLLSTRVSNEVVDVGGAKLTSSITASKGDLVNVIILETWLDKKTNSVWTLLAAKAAATAED